MLCLKFWRTVLSCALLLMLAQCAWAVEEMGRAILSRVEPDYPELARLMHIEGAVDVELTAMPDGSVSRVHAVSGHPLFRISAENCVSHWRFMRMRTAEQGTVSVQFSLTPEH
jgi:outer membrane biosynthesis protein TonB